MPVLGHVTRGRVAATIAVAAAATLLVGCSDNEVLLDDSLRPAPTTERPTYTDQFTVGSATFATNLPDGAVVLPVSEKDAKRVFGDAGKAAIIASWPGHELSEKFLSDALDSPESAQLFWNEGVMWMLGPNDCMGFDSLQNEAETIDSTSPLNGQPVTYGRETKSSNIPIRTNGVNVQMKGLAATVFGVKLDTKPCEAVVAIGIYSPKSPDNGLKDFGYRLFVEGDGTVTTTNP